MLKTQNLVPTVYYNNSRDFQFFGRALDVIFNYSKMNVDVLEGSPIGPNLDDKLIPLLTRTVGFQTRHQYNSQDLKAICNVFATLLRDKGTKTAVESAVKVLMNTQNISGYFNVLVDNTEHVLKVYVPYGLKDLVLLEDLLDYVLPAGYDFRFIYGAGGDALKNTTGVEAKAKVIKVSDGLLGRIAKPNVNITRPHADMDYVEDNGAAMTYTTKVTAQIEEFPDENEGE